MNTFKVILLTTCIAISHGTSLAAWQPTNKEDYSVLRQELRKSLSKSQEDQEKLTELQVVSGTLATLGFLYPKIEKLLNKVPAKCAFMTVLPKVLATTNAVFTPLTLIMFLTATGCQVGNRYDIWKTKKQLTDLDNQN